MSNIYFHAQHVDAAERPPPGSVLQRGHREGHRRRRRERAAAAGVPLPAGAALRDGARGHHQRRRGRLSEDELKDEAEVVGRFALETLESGSL